MSDQKPTRRPYPSSGGMVPNPAPQPTTPPSQTPSAPSGESVLGKPCDYVKWVQTAGASTHPSSRCPPRSP